MEVKDVDNEANPGHLTRVSGSGQGERSLGVLDIEGAQNPARGSITAPPGHSAPSGQREQASPLPHMQNFPPLLFR